MYLTDAWKKGGRYSEKFISTALKPYREPWDNFVHLSSTLMSELIYSGIRVGQDCFWPSLPKGEIVIHKWYWALEEWGGSHEKG